MLRRAAFAATGIARINVFGLQNEMKTPLVANDGIVQTPNDEFGRPAKSAEMVNKYGQMAKYANPNHVKVDTSAEVILNTYPEGDVTGRIENYDKLENFAGGGFGDENFFRKNILKPKVDVKHEDRSTVLDFMLTSALCSLSFIGLRHLLIPVWWVGQMRMTMVNESNIEVEIGQLEFKECKTVVWRGKPVFIYRRNPQQLKAMDETPMSVLKDPETDLKRFPTNREYAVVIAICTHLGCIPTVNEGAFQGFFCPCHGSHYDASARIRQGPAPLNLEVPPNKWINDGLLYLGN